VTCFVLHLSRQTCTNLRVIVRKMNTLICWLLAFSLSYAVTDAAKILIVTFMNESHFLELNGVGQPLLDRGHEVYVLFDSETTLPKSADKRYKVVNYKVQFHAKAWSSDAESQKKFIEATRDINVDDGFLAVLTKDICINMVSDKELFPKLEALKFDLVIVDNFLAPCFFLVPYKLGLPYVSVGSVLFSWYLRLPMLPSVLEPTIDYKTLRLFFCDDDTKCGFMKRFCRLLSFIMVETFSELMFDTEYLREYVSFPTIKELRENASMTLVNRHHLLSSPVPKLPHVEYVGGITTRPGNLSNV
jgi:hypothetical protein